MMNDDVYCSDDNGDDYKDKSDDHRKVDVNGPTAREKFQWRKRAVMRTNLVSFDKSGDKEDKDEITMMMMMMTIAMVKMSQILKVRGFIEHCY